MTYFSSPTKLWLRAATFLVVLLVFGLLGYAYLHPGGEAVLKGETDRVLSDGTDPATLPFIYSVTTDHFWNNPSYLLYGAVPTEQLNPPAGKGLWMPWVEKWSAPLMNLFFPVEQISTVMSWWLMMLNGVFFYLYGRTLKWPRSLSLALGIGFAFNAYTRARAKVHIGLVGAYHLPMIFLALSLLKSTGSRWRVFAAAFLFLGASSVAHYYLVLTVVLAPAFLIFFYLDQNVRRHWKSATGRLFVSALPALLFLGWNFTQPLPAEFTSQGAKQLPSLGTSDDSGFHPFMTRFASQPMDYLGGDTAIGTFDWNPLRSLITTHIQDNLDGSNFHERTNGLHWVIILFILLLLLTMARKKSRRQFSQSARNNMIFFLAFGFFCLLLSLSPNWFGFPIGPSGWVHHLVSHFRVPSRAGIFAQFGFLMAVGLFLNSWGQRQAIFSKALFVLPLIVVADFPPLMNKMPMAQVLPAVKPLKSSCGSGLYFPFVSDHHESLRYYYLIQQMRGTDCRVLNSIEDQQTTLLYLQSFPHHPRINGLIKENDPDLRQKLKRYATCAQLDWLFFDFDTPEVFRKNICNGLNWQMRSPHFCERPISTGMKPDPLKCLSIWLE